MLTSRTASKCLSVFGLICIIIMVLSGTSIACRLYGAISDNLPDDLLYNHLRGDGTNFPDALWYLSPTYPDGWAIGGYQNYGDVPTFTRGPGDAQDHELDYTTAVNDVNNSPEPQIALGHLRLGTSGCFGVDDPHPFYRDKIGRTWTFQHNGGVSKTRMTNLINAADPTYLTNNPPNGSGIDECAAGVVDSELYFLYLLLKIELNGWNVNNGIVEAVNAMVDDGETGGMNFILSDGFRLWAFRRGQLSTHTLYYIYDAAEGYAAAASQYPSNSQGNWIAMDDYQLVMLTGDDAPVVFDVNNYTTELLVDTDFNSSLDSADLRANSEGQDWYESRELDKTLLSWETGDVDGNPTPKAKLSAAGTADDQNAYLTQEFSILQAGSFWVEADIFVDSISNISGNPDRTAFMLVGDNSDATRTGPNSDDPERFVYLAFYKSDGGTDGTMNLVARDRNDAWDNFTTVASGLNLDQWYRIRVLCDIPGGTYDVYVDGVFRATVTSRHAKANVTHISFGEWNDGAGTYYVDNVRAAGGEPGPGIFLVDTDFEASSNSPDLIANSPGQDWYESRNVPPSTLLYLDETNMDGNSSKKAGFTASLIENAYLTQEFGTPQAGEFTVQWKIYVDSILDDGDRDRSAFMLIGDNSDNTGGDEGKGPNSTGPERFVYMAFYSPDGGDDPGDTMSLIASEPGAPYEDSSGWTVIDSGLSFDTWHTITVTCKLDTDTYTVYVNSTTTPSATVDAYTAKNSVTHISFAQWDDGVGSFFVDNVSVPSIDNDVEVIEVQVSSGSDDAEESPSGWVYMNSSDLELAEEDDGGQTVGIRFTGVDIPQGAIIEKAYIQFMADETGSSETHLTIEGEDIDNAPTFVSSADNISDRDRTSASVAWSPPEWTEVGASGVEQQTPDISSVIQQIVGLDEWISGNSLAVIITGSGTRTAESYEGSEVGAPLLHVEYRLAPPACQGDLDEDEDRDGSDLAILIDGYGPTYDEDDLAEFSGVFGTLCP